MTDCEMEFACALSEDELRARGRMLGETIYAIDETNAERAETMRKFKDTLTGLNERQRKLAAAIRSRTETRLVNCVVYYHTPDEGIKLVVRTDTGEVVGEMPMTNAEKQLNLFAPDVSASSESIPTKKR